MLNLSKNAIPQHIAFIMDGNGRWAKERQLPRIAGHRQGVKTLERIVAACMAKGIQYATVYGFSTENWRRSPGEVQGIMQMLVDAANNYQDNLAKQNIRLHIIGRISGLSKVVQQTLKKMQQRTANNRAFDLVLAINYGSETEVVDAAMTYAQEVKQGKARATGLTWQAFSQYLYTAGFPPPDLLVRTSGEKRLSNFLLLQCAYTELYFASVFWPDFDEGHLDAAIADYCQRRRRFGKTG